MTLPLALALSIAHQVAGSVSPDTMVVLAQVESGLHPWSIHDNTADRSYDPASRSEAEALASRLILRDGHNVDLGLLQVSFRGPARDGLTIHDAFDPAHSMRTGGAILVEAYRTCQSRERGEEAILRCASSYYNAGGQTPAGKRYTARVWKVAAQIVPSIGRIIHADFPSAAPVTTDGARQDTIAAVTVAPSPFTKPARTAGYLVYQTEGR